MTIQTIPTTGQAETVTVVRHPRPTGHSDAGGRAGRILVLLVLALYFGLPLLWLLLAPSKTDSELVARNPYAFGSFANYGLAWGHLLQFNNHELLHWIGNSIYYSGASVALTLVATIPAGYALAATRMRWRKTILVATLIAMITPSAARVLPLFLEVNAIHLTNTAASIILPSAFFPFGVYLAFIYYTTSLPQDILNSGRIDGASEMTLFSRLALPLSKPLIGLVGFFSFLAGWNDYFLPFVMLSDDQKYNLPVGLADLISSSPGIHPGSQGTNLPIARPEVALAGLLVIVPVAAIFLVCQRYLVSGILSGSTKD